MVSKVHFIRPALPADPLWYVLRLYPPAHNRTDVINYLVVHGNPNIAQGGLHNARYVKLPMQCSCCSKEGTKKKGRLTFQWRNIRGLGLHLPHVITAGVDYQMVSEAEVAEHEVGQTFIISHLTPKS